MPGKGTPPGAALYPECQLPGTAGRWRHLREGTVTCAHCRAEAAREMAAYRIRRITKGRALVPAVGTQRRIRALARMGWGQEQVAEKLGMDRYNLSKVLGQQQVHRELTEKVRALYRELAWEHGPNDLARKFATTKGWPGPLDWADPDDPDEVPACVIERDHEAALRFHREFRKMVAKREKRASMTEEERRAAQAAQRARKQARARREAAA